MTVELEPASTPAQLAALFALRSRVFLGEGVLKHGSSDLLYDEFDAYPSGVNIVARSDGQLIGGCRVHIGGDVGLPSDRYFDFGSHVPADVTKLACGSMLCVDSSKRSAMIGLALVRLGMWWAVSSGATHACAAVRPEATPLLKRLGFQTVAPNFDHPIEGVPVAPMTVDFAATPARLKRYLAACSSIRQHNSHRRRSYSPGEVIVRDRGGCSDWAVVVAGEARRSGGSRSAVFGVGSVLGDPASPQCGQIVATKPTEVMVLDHG